MSIRAYKLIEIKCDEEDRFNLGLNTLFDLGDPTHMTEGSGFLHFYRDTVEAALVKAIAGTYKIEMELGEYHRETGEFDKRPEMTNEELVTYLKGILSDMSEDGIAEYYCY